MFVITSDLGIRYFNDYLITTEKEIYLNMYLDIEVSFSYNGTARFYG